MAGEAAFEVTVLVVMNGVGWFLAPDVGTGDKVDDEASSDIGQRLFDLVDEADREALKLRYLQDWNRALATTEK